MILPKSYTPSKYNRKVNGSEEVIKSHKNYFEVRPNNLRFLIGTRYEWMKPYLKGKQSIVELGAGAGFSKDIFEGINVKLTDVDDFPWLDQKVDALALPFPEKSCDVIICSYMIHHLSSPVLFFEEALRVLKPGGLLLINEAQSSFLLKLVLFITRHEGWSYNVNVFDKNALAKDPNDQWDGNNAVAEMLFCDHKNFEKHFPDLSVKRDELRECFLFLISGGVTAQFKTVQLPNFILKSIERIDLILIKMFPQFFAMVRRIVLEKTNV